ncbi:hypothetical protein EK21DRAFT_86143 [Setomelanomma holmii]|uniref:Uncharacterized protein n=1 Tax=Setomelanomma holmii TaxID=210430 RepID=A0A9P4HG81_9PLEO|nr:hypothetical protein EK21DRAFT_86143 [Setomelanomma holmii]
MSYLKAKRSSCPMLVESNAVRQNLTCSPLEQNSRSTEREPWKRPDLDLMMVFGTERSSCNVSTSTNVYREPSPKRTEHKNMWIFGFQKVEKLHCSARLSQSGRQKRLICIRMFKCTGLRQYGNFCLSNQNCYQPNDVEVTLIARNSAVSNQNWQVKDYMDLFLLKEHTGYSDEERACFAIKTTKRIIVPVLENCKSGRRRMFGVENE